MRRLPALRIRSSFHKSIVSSKYVERSKKAFGVYFKAQFIRIYPVQPGFFRDGDRIAAVALSPPGTTPSYVIPAVLIPLGY